MKQLLLGLSLCAFISHAEIIDLACKYKDNFHTTRRIISDNSITEDGATYSLQKAFFSGGYPKESYRLLDDFFY